jgi:hypothetical protein
VKLLDAATVNPQDRMANHWQMGYKGVSRECAVSVELQVPCPPDSSTAAWDATVTPLIGTVTSTKTQYDVTPVPIRYYLRQSVSCEQDDDKDWFTEAVIAKTDYAVSRALVMETPTGADTWVGAAGVQSVSLAGNTAANWRTAVAAARKLWVHSVVSRNEHPILHVPPLLAGDLLGAGLLQINGPEEVDSIWGDRVVISDGYDDPATPHVFFTGEIIVRLSELDEEGGVGYDHRINEYSLEAHRWAAIDLAPCAIVRVGA